MKHWIFRIGFLLFLQATTTGVHAGEHGWKCDWFGWGCPEGEQNAVLIDLGRQSTNTGFLFFDGDSAVIDRELELTFSKRAVAKGSTLFLSVELDEPPAGVAVTLDGQNCLAPNRVQIPAVQSPKRVRLRWVVPPNGVDAALDGVVTVTPQGFDRAGSMPLKGKSGPLQLMNLQGEVDDDWHWAKRTTFWFWTLFFSILFLWKFFLAPVFFHRRLKFHGGTVRCFEDAFPLGQHVEERTLRKLGKRRVIHISSVRQKRSAWKDFLHGRSEMLRMESVGGEEFMVLKGKTNKRRGLKLEVRRKQGQRWVSSSVYSKNEPEENRVHFEAEGKPMMLQFEFE